MKQFLKRFRIPLIVVGALCVLSVTALIARRTFAVKTVQGDGESEQAAQTESGAQTAQTDSVQVPGTGEEEYIPIVFSDNGVRTDANEDAVKVSGTDVTIRAPGTYLLSGSCESGSVSVKKGTQGVVLILDDLELTAEGTAAISCNKGTEVTIRAAEGSVNTLADTEDNNDETNPANGNAENAVIKCKDGAQVCLCGTGTLNVTASGKNGIKAGASDAELGEASLTISELNLSVTAPDDGIKADSTLTITSGRITVSAGDDAVCSDTAVTVGVEGTDGPTLEISGCTEGIEAPQVLVQSGSVSIHASDDGINAPTGDGSSDITVSGGTLLVNVEQGDGLDSNGTLNITGGDVRIYSSSRGDNSPVDSESGLSITGGTVLAVGSSGMAQVPNTAAQTYLVFNAGNSIGGPWSGSGGDPNSLEFSLSAGDKLQIMDHNGKVLAEAESVRGADYIFFTSQDLVSGETYTLSINSQSAGTALATDELGSFAGMPAAPGPGGDNRPGIPGSGEFEPGTIPQQPDGNADFGTRPEFPNGDFDPESMPQRPDGDFNPGGRPEPPRRDGGTDAQDGAPTEDGDDKDA